MREISYAQEDLGGGIYDWQSVTQGGVAGKTGGIFRKDFGDASPTSQPFLTPGTTNKCVGCHYLSHDGLRMTRDSIRRRLVTASSARAHARSTLAARG